MTRRQSIAAGLLASAAVLAIVALLLWRQASDDAEAEALAKQYAETIDPSSDYSYAFYDSPDRTPALVVGGLAAICAVGGLVVLAGDDA